MCIKRVTILPQKSEKNLFYGTLDTREDTTDGSLKSTFFLSPHAKLRDIADSFKCDNYAELVIYIGLTSFSISSPFMTNIITRVLLIKAGYTATQVACGGGVAGAVMKKAHQTFGQEQ